MVSSTSAESWNPSGRSVASRASAVRPASTATVVLVAEVGVLVVVSVASESSLQAGSAPLSRSATATSGMAVRRRIGVLRSDSRGSIAYGRRPCERVGAWCWAGERCSRTRLCSSPWLWCPCGLPATTTPPRRRSTMAPLPRRSCRRGSAAERRPSCASGTYERRSEVTGCVDQLRGRPRPAAAAAPAPPARWRRRVGTTIGCSCARPPGRARGGPDGLHAWVSPSGPSYDGGRGERGRRRCGPSSPGATPVYAVDAAARPGLLRAGAAAGRAAGALRRRRRGSASTRPPARRRNSRVAYEGGIVEVVAVTDDPRPRSTDADLSPERATTGGRRPRHGSRFL